MPSVAFMNLSQRFMLQSHRSWNKLGLNTAESEFTASQLILKTTSTQMKVLASTVNPAEGFVSNIPSIATCKPLSEHVPPICCVPLSSPPVFFTTSEGNLTRKDQILVDRWPLGVLYILNSVHQNIPSHSQTQWSRMTFDANSVWPGEWIKSGFSGIDFWCFEIQEAIPILFQYLWGHVPMWIHFKLIKESLQSETVVTFGVDGPTACLLCIHFRNWNICILRGWLIGMLSEACGKSQKNNLRLPCLFCLKDAKEGKTKKRLLLIQLLGHPGLTCKVLAKFQPVCGGLVYKVL